MDDDDLDLDAWQPPAPPPGIADAVLARLHAPAIATPVEVTRRPRKWWVLGGLAIGLAMTSVTAAIVSDALDHRSLSIALGHAYEDAQRFHDELAATKLQLAESQAKEAAAEAQLAAVTAAELEAKAHERWVAEAVGGGLKPVDPTPAKPVDPPKADPPKPAKTADPPKPAKTADPPCDAVALKASGDRAAADGNYAAALTSFEGALACKADPQLEKVAYMVACQAKNVVKAKLHFGRVPATTRTSLRQICIRNGIMLDDPPPPAPAPLPCDADELRKQGDANAIAGLDAQALAAYERSAACRPDPSLIRLEFMESCKSMNVTKVHKYWKMMPAGQKEQMRQICVRNGITDL